MGAAEDLPIKTGTPRAHELIHRREETATQRRRPEKRTSASPERNWECMVVTDPPARMSRTEEVHRITENVYKVRRTPGWSMSPQIHLLAPGRREQVDGPRFVPRWSAAVAPTCLALSSRVRR